MMARSYSIRSKPDWRRKYLDPEIRAKWRQEALSTELEDRVFAERPKESGMGYDREAEELERPRLTEKMVDHVLDELTLHDEMFKETGGIASWFKAVSELEKNPPFGEPDWHPGSNEQVLDLVHPSLFPLVYEKSLMLEVEGKATRVAESPNKGQWDHLFEKYAWLPSDFDVDAEGKVMISSYINNLHPVRHAQLYPILSRLFERFAPLFENVLSDLQDPPPRRIPVDWEVSSNWFGDEPDWHDREAYEKWEETKQIKLPEPEPFAMPEQVASFPAFSLKGRKLHIIVKLANIHLTPEKPDYAGGIWHVEGMQNEEIVASGIYYFAQENIGDSKLSFRGTFEESEVPYEQDDTKGVKLVWGLDPTTTRSLATRDGRAVAFPNLYQHRVSPFSLVDRMKPGYRKILCFFLVDPLKTDAGLVISTSRVPPQQFPWLEDAIWDLPRKAKRVREKLMEERKYLHEENKRIVCERPFSLCEH
ncbi:hypothetical protein Rt10032_c06g2978 [Rhodotorula toruloides]|uniref:Uncharacterized protein n=1 Tax=Rhodotorula toruloides TaxID=5286 RepID=A0A511KF15_RHOTO|nr:hypothetical protein Rt10032_c06g2978 [Rhodotorula toruloides]